MNQKYSIFSGTCVLAVVLTLVGCGGGSSNPQPTSHPETMYATGFNQILSFEVDSKTGGLSIPTSTPGPNTDLASTATIVANPAGKFLFVYDTAGEAIDVFSIDAATRALTLVSGSPFPAGPLGAPGGLTLDPSGKFLYVVGVFGINAFNVNSTSGALTPILGSLFVDTNGPLGAVVVSSGRFLYASDIGTGQAATISGFSVNSSTGALTPVPGSPFSTGSNGSPFFLVAHPSGKFLYAVLPEANSLTAWSVDSVTGALTVIPGFPVVLSNGNIPFFSGIAVDPQGKFLYVSDISGDIFGFTVNVNSGALTALQGSPFSARAITGQLFFDPSGRFLYAPAGTFIFAFSINLATGVPTLLNGLPFFAGSGLTLPATLTFVKAAP